MMQDSDVNAERQRLRQQLWEHRHQLVSVSQPRKLQATKFPRSNLVRVLGSDKGRKILMATSAAIMTKPKLRWVALGALGLMAAVVAFNRQRE